MLYQKSAETGSIMLWVLALLVICSKVILLSVTMMNPMPQSLRFMVYVLSLLLIPSLPKS